MTSSVNTNINAMAAVQSMMDISSQMTQTQAHIQSGLKVGSASDNPAVFTIAQGLRANIGALTAVQDSLATGIATVQGQSAGATSISTTLNTLLQTVTQAQNQTGDALVASNATITRALGNIDAYANATTINGVNLLANAGSTSVLSNVDGTNTVASTATASTTAGLSLSGLAVASAGVGVTSSSVMTFTATAAAGDQATYTSSSGASTTFTFTTTAGNANATTLYTGGTPTATTTAAALNTAIGLLGGTSSATAGAVTLTGGGSLTSSVANGVASGGPANGNTVTFSGAAGTTPVVFTFATTPTAAAGQVAVGGNAAQSMANLVGAMKAVGIQASSSGGVLTLVGGTAAVSGGTLATAATTSGAASILLVNSAISKIGVTLSSLGSATTQLTGLSDFMSKLETSVKTSLGAMVDANLSDESAKLASLQTKQSLAIQSLSLANQGPGALLQLFR